MKHIVAYVHAYVGMGRNAGAETTLHDILRFIVGTGEWKATVIVSQPGVGQHPYSVDGVEVIPQGSKRDLIEWVNRASVLITHLDQSERTAFVGRRFRCPVIHLVHNDMWETRSYLACGCQMAIFNTEWVKAKFTDYDGLSCVVHPPIVAADYATGSPAKDGEYITLVNMWAKKGSGIFYDLADRFPDRKFLAVQGGYGEQDIRSGRDNVTMASHTENMSKIYARSRIMLMPSAYESYGRVAVEAASNGIPSITSRTPGLVEALGPAGIYCETVDEYASAIQKLDHWKAYASASKKSLARFKEIDSAREEELNRMLVMLNGVADTGKLIRGW
ncbi:MAG TPA: glycosyltransferase [Methylomicrobium sp.]|nr:glycosyltransferase [Methylomicrobium sp.]